MKIKVKYQEMVLIVYIVLMMSFIFLKCQDITSQELAASTILLIIPFFNRVTKSKGNYRKLVCLILIFILLEFIRSFMRYEQSIKSIFYLSGELLSLLLYFYFTSFDNKKILNLFDIIVTLYKVFLLCLCLIAILYNLFGIEILDSVAYERLRYGNVRLYYGLIFISIGSILHFGRLVAELNHELVLKINDIFFVFLGIFYYVYIVQSRMMIVVIFIVFILMYILCTRNVSNKIVVLMIGGLFLILVSFLPSIQNYFTENFIAIIKGTDNGTIPRIQAIEHYINVVKESPIFGMGFMNLNTPSNGLYDINYIIRGPWGVFYIDDVGIFGYYLMFGIAGLILYGCILLKIFKQGIKERYTNPHKLGIAIYLVLTSVSMTFFDIQRQAAFMIIFLSMDLECLKTNYLINSRKGMLYEK